jgi:DNA-binding FadR family transcriptional regulator
MFGDHQPGLAGTFYTDVFGKRKDLLSQEESVCLYQVPYVIWANYDIEEKEYGDFSLNYLSTVLEEHRAIFKAFMDKDPREGGRAMEIHVNRAKERHCG